MSIIVSGSLAYDRILNFKGRFAEHILKDKLHALSVSFLVESVEESFGGTAGNIAYSLRLLGEEPVIRSTGGRDFEPYHAWLEKNGIAADAIHPAPEATAFATIMTDLDDNQITGFYPGAMTTPYGPVAPASSDLVIVAPGNMTDMRTVPAECRAAGTPFVYDPGQQITALSGEDLRDGLEGAGVLISNDYEHALICEKTGWDTTELLSRVGMVVTTLGGKGSRATTRDEVIEVGPANPTVVDPTGAGDAYRAGFLTALARGLSPRAALQLGSTMAAFAIEVKGTQNHRPTKEELAERYRENYHEDIAL